MRTQITTLLILLCLVSCEPNETIKEIKIQNFNGIMSTKDQDYEYFHADGAEIDSSDWFFKEYWNQETKDLFSNLPDSSFGVSGDVLLLPFPNPFTDSVRVRVSSILVPYQMSYRLVNKYHHVYRAGDDINVPFTPFPNTFNMVLNLSDVPHNDTLRLYYTFTYNNTCSQWFHGLVNITGIEEKKYRKYEKKLS
jgi:hypothetical protein